MLGRAICHIDLNYNLSPTSSAMMPQQSSKRSRGDEDTQHVAGGVGLEPRRTQIS